MRRLAVILALAACGACALDERPPREPPPPPPAWVYAPAAPVWLGELRGRFGRGAAPQRASHDGIVGAVREPLRLPTAFAVPGDGPARAIVYGLEGVRPAIELVEIDAGRVAWRDVETCAGPVVGVTAAVAVCAGPSGTAAIGLDGKPGWRTEATFIAMTGERVVVAAPATAVVLDAADGEELARVALPDGVGVDAIVASCGDGGRELFASGQDGRLARIADGKAGPAVAWRAPVGAIAELDACTGDTIVVLEAPGALVALARATGAVTGRIDGVRGYWPAPGGDRLDVATAAGVARWPRDLAGAPAATGLPRLGALIAARGERRLVRATPRTAVVVDATGVRAHVPFAWQGGALGDAAALGASWTGSPGEQARRLGLPARAPRGVHAPAPAPGTAVPAELRDLPGVAPLDARAAIAKPDTAMHAVAAVAIDPDASAVLYVATQEHAHADAGHAGLASADLAARAWQWQRGDGCGRGTPVGLAVARDVIVCAGRTATPRAAVVRATSRAGAARWEREADNVDAIRAAGDAVLVHDADRLAILDAATGQVRGHVTSDDGAPVPAAIVIAGDTTFVLTAERGRLVARVPALAALAIWSLAVDGVIRALSPSGAGVLVELEDGDAYRVDVRTAEASAVAGLGLVWRAAGELVTGETAGGPIPGPPLAAAPAPGAGPGAAPHRPPVRRVAVRRPPPIAGDPERPRMWTPIPPPPPLGDSWQYTLYELGGGLRARNDYALAPPVVPAAARGPAGSPLVVASGPDLREVMVLDVRTGDPLRRVQLPEDAAPGLVFGTIVDGTPVAGALLAAPLRVVLF